jgi:hypothetical protein
MKKTNSLTRVLFYAFLVALFFSISNEIAWQIFNVKVILAIYVVMALTALVMLFTEKRT